MNYLKTFEIEALEQRLEFSGPGFWAKLWNAVCWIADSSWDVMQSIWYCSSGFDWNPDNNQVTIGMHFEYFFGTLGNFWDETWGLYWE